MEKFRREMAICLSRLSAAPQQFPPELFMKHIKLNLNPGYKRKSQVHEMGVQNQRIGSDRIGIVSENIGSERIGSDPEDQHDLWLSFLNIKGFQSHLNPTPCHHPMFEYQKFKDSRAFFKIDRSHLYQAVLPMPSTANNNAGRKERICIEFGSPNIAKPFHAGHLRSITIGNALCNLYKGQGHQVSSINYIGDWGTQFGVLVEGFKRFGCSRQLKEDPISHLFKVYVKINALIKEDESIHELAKDNFSNLEKGLDSEVTSHWDLFRRESLEAYRKCYEHDFGLSFDSYEYESSVCMDGSMARLRSDLESAGLLVQSKKGLIGVDLGSEGLPFASLFKPDGSSLYLGRDVATVLGRYSKYQFDRLVYVAGMEQSVHFKQLFAILRRMKAPFADACSHVGFGAVKGMSTRNGRVVLLQEMIKEARDMAAGHLRKKQNLNPSTGVKYDHQSRESTTTKMMMMDEAEVAQRIAMAGIIVQDTASKRVKGYDFDWKRVVSSDGDTGVFLLYTETRLRWLLHLNGNEVNENVLNNDAVEEEYVKEAMTINDAFRRNGNNTEFARLLPEKEAVQLALLLSRYSETLEMSTLAQEPCTLVQYLLDLARATVKALAVLSVKYEKQPQVKAARYALFARSLETLSSGLRILGIRPVPYM